MNNRIILTLLAFCLFIVACSEDEHNGLTEGVVWQAQVSEGDMLSAEHRYNTVGIILSGEMPMGGTLTLSTDADWLTIDSDTLPSDGIFDVLPEANERGTTRNATLTITCQSDGSSRQVILTQESDDGSNADNDWHIGQGFCCFDDYMSEASLRKPIINVAKLQALDQRNGVVSVQDAVRGEEDFELYTAWSLVEMQSILTKITETKVNALFYKKTVKRFTQVSTHSTNEQCYSYARINRIVGSRTMDEGNLRYLLHNEDVIRNNELPFTEDFYKIYRDINNATDATTRASLIRNMLNNYGTHIVVQASVGGAIDLVVSYQRDHVTSLTEMAEAVSRTVFGRGSSSSAQSSLKSVTSCLSAQGAISISGGSKESRTALENRVRQLTTTGSGSLSGADLDNWTNSVTSSAMNDDGQRQNLGVIKFRYIPIWDVFADKAISREVLTQVVAIADEEKNTFSDKDLGIDNYRLPLTSSLMDFSSSASATLVRLVYATPNGSSEAVPVAEVCNEYVPTVRADRRITVIYPIVDGTTRITQGLFPGDGEGNRPAWLVFGGSDVYVSPIDGYGSTDKLDTIYYLHGTLYANNMDVPLRNVRLDTQDHYMTFREDLAYPVVKIGSTYWTRCNMRENMQFGEPVDPEEPDGAYIIYTTVIDDMLYANIFYGNSAGFRESYPGLFDDETDAAGYRLHWYVPSRSDLSDLQTFLGGNCKALLPKQQSGFEAQFAGYYGSRDDLNGGREFADGEETLRYVGEQCFVAAKNNSQTGAVLVLSPDYTLRQVDTNRDRDNWYPVRPCRSSHYKYENL